MNSFARLLLLFCAALIGACAQPADPDGKATTATEATAAGVATTAGDPAQGISMDTSKATNSGTTASAASTEVALTGRSWVLESIGDAPIEAAQLASLAKPLEMQIDGEAARINGFGGCNEFFAGVTIDGQQLSVGPVGASKMYCSDSADLEHAYFAALAQVRSYAITDGVLSLNDEQQQSLLGFRAR